MPARPASIKRLADSKRGRELSRAVRGRRRGRGGLRGERGGAAEGEEGGGAVVGCRRQGGKGHRHICCSLSLSLPLLAASLLMCCAFAFLPGWLCLFPFVPLALGYAEQGRAGRHAVLVLPGEARRG